MANRCFPILALLVITIALAGQPSSRAADTAHDAPVPILFVRPLRDGGGLPAPARGQAILTDRLTTGLVNFLRERGVDHVAVVDSRSHDAAKPGTRQPWLALEGDLSRTAGEVPEHDIYLLTVRLVQEDGAHRIVAQWSGSARTLLYLTSNVRHDQRFSESGLIGEMGARIIETMRSFGSATSAEQQKTLARLMQGMKSGNDFAAGIVSPMIQAPAAPATPAPLHSREAYRLSVRSSFDGEVYVIARADDGPLQPMLIPHAGAAQAIPAGRPLLLPENGDWKAPVVLKPATLELLVLARKARIAPPVPAPDAHPNGGITFGQAAPGPQSTGLDADPDVQVMNAGNRYLPRSAGSVDIARLLTQIEADGAQNWYLARLPLKVTPAETRKVAVLSVGIDRYPHIAGSDLAFARQDAEQVAAFWRSQNAVTVQLLTDAQATRQGILEAWSRSLEQAGPGSLVILHWSGHGVVEQGTQWLLPADAEANRHDSWLPVSELMKQVVVSRVGSVMVLLDATGGSADAMKQLLIDALSPAKSALSAGVLAVNGDSFEDTDIKGGILTHALLATMRSRVDGKQSVEFYELAQQVQKEARRLLPGKSPEFTPICALYGSDFLVLSGTPNRP